MDFREAMGELGRPMDWRESILAIRDEHGPGASRHIASTFGVSMRTAQRWLAGTQQPARHRREEVRAAGDRKRVAARALRSARTVSVGRVKVINRSTGRPDGTRPVGVLDVDQSLRTGLGETAREYVEGDATAAGDVLSDALLSAYSEQRASDNRSIAAGALLIYDYPTGIDVG